MHETRAREAADECIHGVRAGDAPAVVRAAALAPQRRAQQVTWVYVEVSKILQFYLYFRYL